jgi:hypothetical protein
MILNNSVIFNNIFNDAMHRLVKKELPAVSSLRLLKILKAYQEQSKDLFSIRDLALERYGTDVKTAKFKSEDDRMAFEKEMYDLLHETFEIVGVEKLVIPATIYISVDDLTALESIIDIDKSLENK